MSVGLSHKARGHRDVYSEYSGGSRELRVGENWVSMMIVLFVCTLHLSARPLHLSSNERNSHLESLSMLNTTNYTFTEHTSQVLSPN